jgi:hypothetical protein
VADRENLFEALKNTASDRTHHKPKENQSVFFQIKEEDAGFVLEVVDKRGIALEADYRAFSGVDRDVLKAFNEVRWSWDATRIWDDSGFDGSGLLLHEHSHLMGLLARSGKVVDEHLKPLDFLSDPMELQLVLDLDDGDWVKGRFRLRSADGAVVALEHLRLVSESHLMADQTIYCIQPLRPTKNS